MTMTWSQALDAYMTKNSIASLVLAVFLKISPSRVHYWRHGSEPRGEQGLAVKRQIEKWSKGEVQAAPYGAPAAAKRRVPSKRTGTDG